MQCPSPISIQDPRQNKTSVRISVPCKKCEICLQNRRSDWTFRLTEELRTAESAWFITLTYADENIPYTEPDENGEIYATLYKRDIQLFNHRLRKAIAKYHTNLLKKQIIAPSASKPLTLRFFATGEYGSETDRPHYHGIYFNVPRTLIEKLQEIWKKGQTHFGTCTPASIHYVTKYCISSKKKDHKLRLSPYSQMSKNPAIGHGYIKRNTIYHINNLTSTVILNGHPQKMPDYYRDKIFTETERAKIGKFQQELGDKRHMYNEQKYGTKENPWEKQLQERNEALKKVITKQSKSQ